MAKDDLIPISMINTLIYCPRRFHYEFVQGEWKDNVHTTEGKIKHERVDKPVRGRKERDKIVTRRQYIASENLGVAGYVDLLEEKKGKIYPVEYKKGKGGGWLNDKIQLCLQAMVLEETLGRKIPFGYIYYISSHRRRKVEFDDDLRSRTKEAILRARAIASNPNPPEPVHDNRCNGCSIRDICLPDETAYLKDQTERPKRFRLSLGMEKVLYVDSDGAAIKRTGERILVVLEGETIRDIPIIHVDQVVICGNVSLTTPAMQWLMNEGIPVTFLSRYGRYQGALTPALSKNSLLRVAQHKATADERFVLDVARRIVRGKLVNMRVTVLRRARRRKKDEKLSQAATRLSAAIKATDSAGSLDELLGIEGSGTQAYFEVFGSFLKDEMGFSFERRTRRPPTDPVNALLSFAYTLLVSDMVSAIQTVGLDPYVGFYHQLRYGRPCLALDLMEEFRPTVADSVVLSLVNNGVVKQDDFYQAAGGWFLKDAARKRFYAEYERRKNERITHPVFGYKLSFRQAMELQARILAKVIIGEIKRYEPLTVR